MVWWGGKEVSSHRNDCAAASLIPDKAQENDRIKGVYLVSQSPCIQVINTECTLQDRSDSSWGWKMTNETESIHGGLR